MNIVSNLEPSINYNQYFLDTSLHDDDINTETSLYKINIFGNNYHIAMGNKNIHSDFSQEDSKKLIFFPVYLIYNNKVFAKIGVYELYETDDEILKQSVNFEELNLILDNKYYSQPYLLEDFTIKEYDLPNTYVVANEEEKVEENKGAENKGISNAIQTEDKTILLYGNYQMIPYKTYNDNYIMLNKLTNGGKLFTEQIELKSNGKAGLNSKIYYNLNSVIRPIIDNYCSSGEYKEYIVRSIKSSLSSIYGTTTVMGDGDKKKTTFNFNLKNIIGDYINTKKNTYNYFIDTSLLITLEYLLDIKIIIINSDNTIKTFGIIPYLQGNIGDFVEKLEPKKQIAFKNNSILFKNYNPDKFMFVHELFTDVFEFLEYNGEILHDIKSFQDETLLARIKYLYENIPHEYFMDSQLSIFKDKIMEVEPIEVEITDYILDIPLKRPQPITEELTKPPPEELPKPPSKTTKGTIIKKKLKPKPTQDESSSKKIKGSISKKKLKPKPKQDESTTVVPPPPPSDE